MAILDSLLGGSNNGSILDGVLGGGGDNSEVSANSSEFGAAFGTNPQLGVGISDVLHSESHDGDDEGNGDHESFTGIGDIGIGFAAPTFLGVQSSSESFNASESDDNGGGLLGGLL
jgi:hypothetical protein